MSQGTAAILDKVAEKADGAVVPEKQGDEKKPIGEAAAAAAGPAAVPAAGAASEPMAVQGDAAAVAAAVPATGAAPAEPEKVPPPAPEPEPEPEPAKVDPFAPPNIAEMAGTQPAGTNAPKVKGTYRELLGASPPKPKVQRHA